MLVVIGAGIAGLTAALSLAQSHPHSFVLVLEARHRLGGRAHTSHVAGIHVDLGATWIWPQQNPSILNLVNRYAILVKPEATDSSASRFQAGVQPLVETLRKEIEELPNTKIHLNCSVVALERDESQSEPRTRIKIRTRREQHENAHEYMYAKAVFIACPPRIADEHIQFAPALSPQLSGAMRNCPTWMSQQAKFVAVYDTKVWQNPPSPSSSHKRQPRMFYWHRLDTNEGPLETLFENEYVLWGFVSNEKKWRQLPFERRKQLALNQLREVIGNDAALNPSDAFEQDWAKEKWTCSKLDRKAPSPWLHPHYKNINSILRNGHWNNSLWFIASETSEENPGFLDGAVHAGQEIARKYAQIRQAPQWPRSYLETIVSQDKR